MKKAVNLCSLWHGIPSSTQKGLLRRSVEWYLEIFYVNEPGHLLSSIMIEGVRVGDWSKLCTVKIRRDGISHDHLATPVFFIICLDRTDVSQDNVNSFLIDSRQCYVIISGRKQQIQQLAQLLAQRPYILPTVLFTLRLMFGLLTNHLYL